MKSICLVIISGISLNMSLAQIKAPAPQPLPFALVELFTSENCMTCIPADELMKKIKADAAKTGKNIFTVAYHVDYWNKYGWKDPYSKLQFTYIQQNYMSALNLKEIYTPQVFINGKAAHLGSDEKSISASIASALKSKAAAEISIRNDSAYNDTLYISYQSTLSSDDYSIKVLLLEDGIASTVGGGENKGKTFNHMSVCRVYQSKALKTKTGQVKLPLKGVSINKNQYLIAFVQQKGTLKVLGICRARL